jgi:hypothetical protein
MKNSFELPIPPATAADENAFEIVRVWVASGQQHVSCATKLWEDEAAWGIMLVDLARHIARAYELAEGRNPKECLLRIKQGFDAEWSEPTDSADGQLLG